MIIVAAYTLSESQFVAAVLVSAAVMVTLGWVQLQPPAKDDESEI